MLLPYDIGEGVLQGALFISGLWSKMEKPSAWCRVPNCPSSVCHESLLKGRGSRSIKGFSSIDGEVEVHRFSGTGEVVSGAFLDVSLLYVPGIGSGEAQDLSIDWGEFWPLEVGAVRIEGVLLLSVLESKELSRTVLVSFGVDVGGDVGVDPDFLGDVSVREAIGLLV